jgi:hypothetical protein
MILYIMILNSNFNLIGKLINAFYARIWNKDVIISEREVILSPVALKIQIVSAMG